MAALRGFLLSVVDVEVVKTQGNRVPMPKGAFVMMTTMGMPPLATPTTRYHDTGVYGSGTESNTRSTTWRVQLDFYGAGSAGRASTFAILMRTDYACRELAGTPIQPLDAGEPRNTTLLNGEQQYEERFTLDVEFQFNPTVTTPQDFAAALVIQLAEVDATFPPGD